jgi:hypothetical protein
MPKTSNGAAYRAYMRKHGHPPPAQATATETMLYIACLNYREHKFYREDEKDMHEANRLMIRALAVTLVWKRHPDEPVTLEEVKALEKDFMRRVKDDPPF